jgi:hypothetical protein
MQTIKKRVAFEDNIMIRHYEYFREEELEEKLGKDWQRTQDLTCREFTVPIEKGGCGRNWRVLQYKLDKLGEPCWRMIGMLWHSLHPCAKRLEEDSDDGRSSEDEYIIDDGGSSSESDDYEDNIADDKTVCGNECDTSDDDDDDDKENIIHNDNDDTIFQFQYK